MRRVSIAAAAAIVAGVFGIFGCGGSDDPITLNPLLVGTWAAQNMGWPSTMTCNADGTVQISITHPEDQDDPEIQTGTWYTRGNTLYLTDAVTGEVSDMGYRIAEDGNSFTVTEGMEVVWTRVL